MKVLFYVSCLVLAITANRLRDKYMRERNKILSIEESGSVGGNIKLNAEESHANAILMKLKNYELQEMVVNSTNFYMSSHFFQYKDKMKKSKVYDVIKRMPKGALLHLHLLAPHSANFLLNMTHVFSDLLYVCYGKDDYLLMFSRTLPNTHCDMSESKSWINIKDLRKKFNNVDEVLLNSLALTKYDNIIGANINTIWRKFEKKFVKAINLITFKPILKKYFYDFLKTCYNDNIMYVEVRTSIPTMYDLNNNQFNSSTTTKFLANVAANFKETHPDFIGFKIILSENRNIERKELKKILEEVIRLKEEFPDIIAGFDVVGQEDTGQPLFEMKTEFLEYKDKIDFFFHAGETNWYGLKPDENLVDAILLGTKRIGHGYALSKHPSLVKLVKDNQIAVEVNVLSNSILSHVKDVRNHPLSYYLAAGLPVVISSDDPGLWGSELLTDDFFVTFMGIASAKADLRLLKQLVLNSIEYSVMDTETKKKAVALNEIKWKKFTDFIIQFYG